MSDPDSETRPDLIGVQWPAPHPQGALERIVALHKTYPAAGGTCEVCGTYWPCDTVMLARPGELAARAKYAGFWEGHPDLARICGKTSEATP